MGFKGTLLFCRLTPDEWALKRARGQACNHAIIGMGSGFQVDKLSRASGGHSIYLSIGGLGVRHAIMQLEWSGRQGTLLIS